MDTPEEHHEIIAAANDAGIVARIEGDLALRLMDDPELAQQKATRAARAAFRAAFLRGRLAAWGIVPTCPACDARPMTCGGGETEVGAWASLACDCPRRYWTATKYGVLPWVYDYESGPALEPPREAAR